MQAKLNNEQEMLVKSVNLVKIVTFKQNSIVKLSSIVKVVILSPSVNLCQNQFFKFRFI